MEKFDIIKALGYYVGSKTAEYRRAYQNWAYRNSPKYRKCKRDNSKRQYAKKIEGKPKRIKMTEEERIIHNREYQKEYQSRPEVKARKKARMNAMYRNNEEYHDRVLAHSNAYQRRKRELKKNGKIRTESVGICQGYN